MNHEQAQAIIDQVKTEQAKSPYGSVSAVCKAANVTLAAYKDARFVVFGPNNGI